jgi:hypothetical protein
MEHAFGNGATLYGNGTKSYQRTFGMDAIINFGNALRSGSRHDPLRAESRRSAARRSNEQKVEPR